MTTNNTNVRGYGSYCKKCVSATRRERYDYDDARWARIFRAYGMTKAEYVAMFEAQNGLCACCGEPPAERAQGRNRKMVTIFHIDHDHETNKVRALLCLHCNTGLGYMRERPDLMHKFIAYLEQHADPTVTYQPSRDPVTKRVKYLRAAG